MNQKWIPDNKQTAQKFAQNFNFFQSKLLDKNQDNVLTKRFLTQKKNIFNE